MTRRKTLLAGAFIGVLQAMVPAATLADERTANTRDPAAPIGVATLIASPSSITPGRPFRLAVRLVMPAGWHTYWRNPGDAGAPTAVVWTLPPGFTAGPVDWPTPSRFVNGPVVSYGYTDEVWLMTTITAAADLPAGSPATLAAVVDWLACADICVPETASLRLQLPVIAAAPATMAVTGAFKAAEARLPQSPPWPLTAMATAEDTIRLEIGLGTRAKRVTQAWFFPDRFGMIENSGPQMRQETSDGLRLTLPQASVTPNPPAVLEGVLVLETDGQPPTGYVVRTDIRS